ncbi:hypothetical protein AMTR_s04040p00001540, partial [Amborella trichopoda]
MRYASWTREKAPGAAPQKGQNWTAEARRAEGLQDLFYGTCHTVELVLNAVANIMLEKLPKALPPATCGRPPDRAGAGSSPLTPTGRAPHTEAGHNKYTSEGGLFRPAIQGRLCTYIGTLTFSHLDNNLQTITTSCSAVLPLVKPSSSVSHERTPGLVSLPLHSLAPPPAPWKAPASQARQSNSHPCVHSSSVSLVPP